MSNSLVKKLLNLPLCRKKPRLKEIVNVFILLTIMVFTVVAMTSLILQYDPAPPPLPEQPVVVFWTKFFSQNISDFLTATECSFQCSYLHRTLYDRYANKFPADAFILHGRDLNSSDLPKKTQRNLMVFFLMESPMYLNYLEIGGIPTDFFNATISYTETADYHRPYAMFLPISNKTQPENIITQQEIKMKIGKKKKGALMFVSNCNSFSDRNDIIKQLKQHTQVTVMGQCYDMNTANETCDRNSSCEAELFGSHRFYLALENSDCSEYVTEKFYKPIVNLLVPIVRRRRIHSQAGTVPAHSFIAVDDFASIKDLANYLNKLQTDDELYLSYFAWTKMFERNTGTGNALCRLCEDLHKQKKKQLSHYLNYVRNSTCYHMDGGHTILVSGIIERLMSYYNITPNHTSTNSNNSESIRVD